MQNLNERPKMSIYHGLRDDFIVYRDNMNDAFRNDVNFISNFAEFLQKYVECPEFYQGENGKERYIKIYQIELNKHDETIIYHEIDRVDIITPDHEGYTAVGFGITLEYKENAFPKRTFQIPCKFRISDGVCKLKITAENDGMFNIALDKRETYYPAFDYMIARVKKTLRRLPQDNFSEKQQIGFGFPTA